MTALYEEINTITRNKEAVIIGDFNCPNVDWNLMHGDQESNRLVEIIGFFFYVLARVHR